MLGIIGLSAILGCVAGSVIAAAVSAIAIGVSIGVSAKQAKDQKAQHKEMLDMQEAQQAKEQARLEAQKALQGRRLERQHIKNLQIMGTGILINEIATRNAKHRLARTNSEMGLNKSPSSTSNNYNYGNPTIAVAKISQAQQSNQQLQA